jgi:hypothetical protein
MDKKPGGNTMRFAKSARYAFIVVLGIACIGAAIESTPAEEKSARSCDGDATNKARSLVALGPIGTTLARCS